MKKMWIGLVGVGVFAFTAGVNADGFDESDRGLIAGKDVPFPTDESVLPEADDDSTSTDDSGKSEKEYTPEVQGNQRSRGMQNPPPQESYGQYDDDNQGIENAPNPQQNYGQNDD